jgi:N-acetylmuramoyl-L-alanine amidase
VISRGFYWPFCMLAGALIAALPAIASPDRPAATPVAAAENIAVATDARLGGDETRTRLIVDLSRAVDLTAFTLADPYRVVVDLPQIAFQLPPKAGEAGRGLVKAFRFGLVMPGGSRIVLDASGPVRIDKAFVLESIDGQPARLVLDLVAVDRETFLRNLALESKPRRQTETPRKGERESAVGNGDGRPVVVIDPGHGGLDTGTIAGSGQMEKGIVLEFAQQLREKLEKSGKYRVLMTRTDDSFVSLGERVRIARANKAALFISIHADALGRRNAHTRGASSAAEAENKPMSSPASTSLRKPTTWADILVDLAQRETKTFSARFARTLVGELRTAARLHKNPLKSAGFKVPKGARYAFGAGGTRLRVQPRGPQADDLRQLAPAQPIPSRRRSIRSL